MRLGAISDRLRRSPFARNVTIVASGTVAAQVINVAFAPLITRLYGPEAFGVLGTFMAMVAVLAPLAALSYPLAIVLPKNDADAWGIGRLSLRIAAGTSILATFVLLIFSDQVVSLLDLGQVTTVVWLLPFAMYFSVWLTVLSQWAIRMNLFGLKAKMDAAKALLVNGAITGVGMITPLAAVLVFMTTVGTALHAVFLSAGVRRTGAPAKRSAQTTALHDLARRHRDFAVYRAPQNLINAVSHGLPIIALAGTFGAAFAGYYALARMVMAVPAALVAQSVGEVFYPKIAEARRNGDDQQRLILQATTGLALIGFAPFATVIAIGPWLFSIVFGADWAVSGDYARWLSLMFYFNFINRPSVAAIPVLGLQRGLAIYEVFSTGAKILALYVGVVVLNSDLGAVILYSISGAFAYAALIAWVIHGTK